jgi:alpha/beta superfamily hydrolase
VRLDGEHPVVFPSARGDAHLAGLLARRDPTRALLVCHPHPLYGGTMHNAMVLSLCRAAAARGCSTLRFHFRGIEGSTGAFDGGVGEIDDAVGALALLRRELPGAAVDLVGYSFGAYVGLAASVRDGAVRARALLAPAPGVFDHLADAVWPGGFARRPAAQSPTTVLVGTRDAFCTPEEAQQLAAALEARVVVLAEADHYFVPVRRVVATAVLDALAENEGPVSRVLPLTAGRGC